MAKAFIELNEVEQGRICQEGFEVMLQHTKQSTLEQQASEIKDLKRKLAQTEQQRDSAWEHCDDLHDRCDILLNGVWGTRAAI